MAKKKDDGLSLNNLKVIAKRFGVTAREVRDIATAVSTAGRAAVNTKQNIATKKNRKIDTVSAGEQRSLAAKNLAKQIGEVYTAATKGKSGTKSAQMKSVKSRSGVTVAKEWKTPTKRKQGGKK